MLLLDSNVLIGISQRQIPLSSLRPWGFDHAISLVTRIEVLGFPFPNPASEAFVTALVNSFRTLPISDAIAEETIRLRRQYRRKLPDMLIAATARVHDLPLCTLNIRDFQGMVPSIIQPGDLP